MLYLFHGSDEFSRSEAVAALRQQIPPDLLDLNSTVLAGRTLKLSDLAVACEAVPFLTDRRLVLVSDALKHLKAGKARDDMRSYLEQVPPTCDLVFVEDEVDKRSSLFTYLKKHGEVREFAPRQGTELARWLIERATHLDARLNQQTAQHLITYVGHDSRLLITELQKLATYVGQGGRITNREIDVLVQDSQEYNLFAFLDHLSMRRRGAALQGIRALLNEGQAPTYILFMLARQVRILLGVYELDGQRVRPNDIASHLRLKPFVVKKALEQVRGFRAGELERMHDYLLELDHATKTGRMPADVALDMLVMKMCSEA